MIDPNPSENTPVEDGASLQAESIRDGEPNLLHGFTAALPGPPGTSFEQAVSAHLRGITGEEGPCLRLLEQYHSAEILYLGGAGESVSGDSSGAAVEETAHPVGANPSHPRGDGIALGRGVSGFAVVRTADCVPVLLRHDELGQAAALHAGWRGAAAGIVPNMLELWARQAGGTETVRIAFGPSIRSCCYEVGSDCLTAFDPAHLDGAVTVRDGSNYLELTKVLLNQAREAGLGDDQVEILPHCTCCYAPGDGGFLFASHRRGQRTGVGVGARNAAYVGFATPG